MSRLTIDLSMSLDGYVAGPDPSLEDPLGAGGERLHEWADVNGWLGRERGSAGGGEFLRSRAPNSHRGRRNSPQGRVSTTTTSESGRRSQKLVASPARSDRIPTQRADTVQIHVAPILLGSGTRLFEGVADPPGLEIDRVIASPAVTHLRYKVAS